MKHINEYITESKDYNERYKNVNISYQERVKKDFDWLSGITTDDAVKFIKAFIDNTSFTDGEARLFYSGYSGWTLIDSDGDKFAWLMYDKTKVGLEDAFEGKGWELRIKNLNGSKYKSSEIIKMRDWVAKNGSKYNKPMKPRM